MLFNLVVLIFWGVFNPTISQAAVKDWPQEARTYLNALPQQTLTLETVVQQAVTQSDIFQAHKSEALRAEAVEMQTLSAEDLTLTTSYNYFDRQTDPINPAFQTIRTSGWEARVGAEQYFSTGTNIFVEGVHGPQKLQYRTNPTIDTHSTALSVTLTQSLWNDFFGTAYRSERRSAKKSKEAINDGMMNQIEISTLDVINLYYQAWLKQQVTQNLLEGKERREKLVRILRGQERRKVVETTDLLQVESVTLSREVDYLNTQRDLQASWEILVTQLKLPASFMGINASEVPLKLDSPEDKSLQLCQQLKFTDLEKNSYQLKQAVAATEAAREQVQAMESKMKPDLSFQANYTANGVDPSGSETVKNVESQDYPAYTAGVYLTWPLQNRAQKAQYLAAKAQYDQLRHRGVLLETNLQAQWGILCKTLDQKRVSRDKYKQVNERNKRRVALENRRFQMGRIRALEWTQAEEDEANDYLKYQQAEVEVRLVSWEIQRQTGALSDLIRPFMASNKPSQL